MPGHSEFTEAEARAAFEGFVHDARPRVEARLTAFLGTRADEAGRHGADVAAMVESVRSLTLRGGKRLRAALVLAAFRATGGGGDEAAAIDVGASLELLQTYLLIHDDWMDGDLVRRSGPSVHAMLRQHFADDAKGDASAVLAGDYASALSQELIVTLPLEPERRRAVAERFVRIQRDAVYGQQLDVAAHEGDVEAMHALKTGSYTVAGPLLLGAAVAGASPAIDQALSRFADPLGVAFQLRDDLLGTFGRPEETGKPFGNDLRAGKRTALVVEARPLLDDVGRAALARVFGQPGATEADILTATETLQACGARRAVEARIDELATRSRTSLLDAPFTREGQRLLAGAASILTARVA